MLQSTLPENPKTGTTESLFSRAKGVLCDWSQVKAKGDPTEDQGHQYREGKTKKATEFPQATRTPHIVTTLMAARDIAGSALEFPRAKKTCDLTPPTGKWYKDLSVLICQKSATQTIEKKFNEYHE